MTSTRESVSNPARIPRVGEREREERKQRVVGHEEIVGRVSALLFAADPVGINFDDNTDEYDLEAEMIVIRLLDGVLQSDLQAAVYETFVRCFGPEVEVVGPASRYQEVSDKIWDAWCIYRPVKLLGSGSVEPSEA